ncbi:MAG TPA: hypothetical protein VFP23_10625 [Solirubrobacterales bacterium]|nr:hypothetical protein [Solirubrobacterales bacterium]
MPEAIETTWAGGAFGLALRSEFALPGLKEVDARDEAGGVGGPGGGDARSLALELGPTATPSPDADWGERVQEWRYPNGTIGLAIDSDPKRGYRFYVEDGTFELTPDGRWATAHPAPNSAWRWRRYLTGQVLPFAALLQGLEVFHASAVEIDGSAVALLGGSGVGKSTLALNLHLAGAGFVTDDVIAVERSGSTVVVHPGIPAAKVRQAARELIGPDPRGALGEPASEDDFELRFRVEGPAGPLPLGVVCLLEPSAGDAEIEFAEERADPWRLLGNTFNLIVQDSERLNAQLDLCAQIASQAHCLRVRVPSRPGPEAAAGLAARLWKLP